MPFARWWLASLLLLPIFAGAAHAQVEVVPASSIPMDLPTESFPDTDFAVAAGNDGRAIAVWGETNYGTLSSKRDRTVARRVFDPTSGTFEAVHREAVVKGVRAAMAVSGAHSRYAVSWALGRQPEDRQLFGHIADGSGAAITNPTSLADVFQKGFGVRTVAADGGDAGHVVAWQSEDRTLRARRIGNDGSTGVEVVVESFFGGSIVDVANTPDGGFVVAQGGSAGEVHARGFTPGLLPKDDVVIVTMEPTEILEAIAASPVGDVITAVTFRQANPHSLILRRFTSSGVVIGSPITVADLGGAAGADAAYDRNGNLLVVWAQGGYPFQWRAYHPDGSPFGPAVMGSGIMAGHVQIARLTNGDFVNVGHSPFEIQYNVVSLCAPGSSVCGDGALDPLCEICDDGASNSDLTPDACRSNCKPARCGDGTVDSAETCDDGNTNDCDGCSAGCLVEAGLGCGDGMPFPSCGEPCDDGNPTDGDGCSACTLERADGGGSGASDCFAAWSIDNAANEPRYGKDGSINAVQVCTDGDARCDFDGGVNGSCTFHVRVCANNTALATCTPATRLASWEMRSPSASQAANRPALAAVRNAFLAVVPGSVVGPSQPDVCSPVVEVPVALRGSPGSYKDAHLTLKTRAALYDGRSDSDKLRLECVP